MAFVKLIPPDGRDPHPVQDIIERLRDEFQIVDADPDAGQDHVAGMIAATLRFSDTLPGKQERLAWFHSIQHSAVYVVFGDDYGVQAGCCVMPESELFFGSRDEVDGPARPLVVRAASALNYDLFDG